MHRYDNADQCATLVTWFYFARLFVKCVLMLWRTCGETVSRSLSFLAHSTRLLIEIDDDARAPTRKLLSKWRPLVLDADTANVTQPDAKQTLINTALVAPSVPSPPNEDSTPGKQEMAPSAVAAAS